MGAQGSINARYRVEYNIIAATSDMSAANNSFQEVTALIGDKIGGSSGVMTVLNVGSTPHIDVDWTKEIDWRFTVEMGTADPGLSVISPFYYVTKFL